MSEELMIIEMNIARYEAMLTLDLGSQKRVAVKRLLAECQEELMLASKELSQLKLDRCAVSGKFPRERTVEDIGRRLLDVIVYIKNSRVGAKLNLDDLVETTEVGDWKMPDFKMARTYAVSQGWLLVAGDMLTLTTAGLAAA
jgi:hypothetical protein